MRANEKNRVASYNSIQSQYHVPSSPDKENYTIQGEMTAEIGLDLSEIRSFKKQLERS